VLLKAEILLKKSSKLNYSNSKRNPKPNALPSLASQYDDCIKDETIS